jgi:hypothetical protein
MSKTGHASALSSSLTMLSITSVSVIAEKLAVATALPKTS